MESGAVRGGGWGSERTDGVMEPFCTFCISGAALTLPLREADNGASPDLEAPKSGSICRATRISGN